MAPVLIFLDFKSLIVWYQWIRVAVPKYILFLNVKMKIYNKRIQFIMFICNKTFKLSQLDISGFDFMKNIQISEILTGWTNCFP